VISSTPSFLNPPPSPPISSSLRFPSFNMLQSNPPHPLTPSSTFSRLPSAGLRRNRDPQQSTMRDQGAQARQEEEDQEGDQDLDGSRWRSQHHRPAGCSQRSSGECGASIFRKAGMEGGEKETVARERDLRREERDRTRSFILFFVQSFAFEHPAPPRCPLDICAIEMGPRLGLDEMKASSDGR